MLFLCQLLLNFQGAHALIQVRSLSKLIFFPISPRESIQILWFSMAIFIFFSITSSLSGRGNFPRPNQFRHYYLKFFKLYLLNSEKTSEIIWIIFCLKFNKMVSLFNLKFHIDFFCLISFYEWYNFARRICFPIKNCKSKKYIFENNFYIRCRRNINTTNNF